MGATCWGSVVKISWTQSKNGSTVGEQLVEIAALPSASGLLAVTYSPAACSTSGTGSVGGAEDWELDSSEPDEQPTRIAIAARTDK
jgi:hypothetical protein